MDFLELRILMARQTLAMIPDDDPDRGAHFNVLGSLLGQHHALTGSQESLVHAIEAARKAVEVTPEGHPGRDGRLNNLGNRLESLYQETGAPQHLEEAIQVTQEALKLTDDNDPHQPITLSSLSNKLEYRYSRTGNMRDLEHAIAFMERAIELTPENHEDRAAWLNNLGNKLFKRYLQVGSQTDLDTAIRFLKDAVDLGSKSATEQAMKLNNLGVALDRQYSHTGYMADLEEAIEISKQGLALLPESSPQRSGWLTNLATKLKNRYNRTRKVTDINEAVRYAKAAVDSTRQGNSSLPFYLNNLANILQTQFHRTMDLAHLEEAIIIARQALELTPANHPDMVPRLSNLGSKLGLKYLETHSAQDIDEAIELAKEALKSTPNGHPGLAGRLVNLATMFESRHVETGDATDRTKAWKAFQDAWNCEAAIPFTRINAARHGMKLLAQSGEVTSAAELGKSALQLLPSVNTRQLDKGDQQFVVSTFSGVASDLCAFILDSGRAEDALQYLETGRAVILGQLLESQGDAADLLKRHPDLFHRYKSCLERVNDPYKNGLPSKAQALIQRRQALTELNDCIEIIRSLPGHQDFLSSQRPVETKGGVADGVAVVINVSFYRCDAIIVQQGRIWHIALPLLQLRDVEKNGQDSRLDSLHNLEWLWDAVAKPVLDGLGHLQCPGDDSWPHIWWVPTGPLSKFPLHAAGYHKIGTTETVLDRVVSSYTWSVKALVGSQKRRIRDSTPTGPAQVLLVAMEQTPEQTNLPFTTQEISKIRDMCESVSFRAIEPTRRKEDIVRCLLSCQIFHFAGHGQTNFMDPSQSCLLLEDWKSDPLTIAALMDVGLDDHAPFLAYLSACGTGQVLNDKYLDESIHLIAACQLAGFRNVIGTLWEVSDESSVEMARMTYEGIIEKGMVCGSVCQGLHGAIRELRNRWLNMCGNLKASEERRQGLLLQAGSEETQDASGKRLKDATLARDVVPCEDDDGTERLPWVPFVHFGL